MLAITLNGIEILIYYFPKYNLSDNRRMYQSFFFFFFTLEDTFALKPLVPWTPTDPGRMFPPLKA